MQFSLTFETGGSNPLAMPAKKASVKALPARRVSGKKKDKTQSATPLLDAENAEATALTGTQIL